MWFSGEWGIVGVSNDNRLKLGQQLSLLIDEFCVVEFENASSLSA